MNDIWQLLSNAFGQVAGIALLLASVVLWSRRRTPWLLIALIGQIVAMSCRLLFAVSPSVLSDVPVLRAVWPLASCLFALGLLGHAWFENAAPSAAVAQESRQ